MGLLYTIIIRFFYHISVLFYLLKTLRFPGNDSDSFSPKGHGYFFSHIIIITNF